MYRQRMRQQVLYAQFREYLAIAERIIEFRRARGMAVPTVLAPAFGVGNEVVWDTDYPDLATFERENAAFHSDAGVMEDWRRLWQLVVQGSTYDEMLQEAPHIA